MGSTSQFDCAIISFGLHEKHETLRQTIFSKARKVVKQAGSLIIADYSAKSSGIRGFLIGGFIIPVIERLAGKSHYQNYLSWSRQGGFEGFLQHRTQTAAVIFRPFASSVICCVVTKDDDIQTNKKHFALLNKTFSTDSLITGR